MERFFEIINPIPKSIEFWESEGFSKELSLEFFEAMVGFMPSFVIQKEELPITIFDIFQKTGICSSGADVKRFLKQNALSINNIKLSNSFNAILEKDFAFNKFLILGKGKSERAIIVLE